MSTSLRTSRQFMSRALYKVRLTGAQAYLSSRRRMGGHTLWVDYGCIKLPYHADGDRQELFYHVHSRKWWNNESTLLSRYVGKGDVAVDVGANLGFLTGILATLTGKGGQVHSFEPSPPVFAKLVEVIRENNYITVTPYNLGCGSGEQTLTLYCPSSSGNASLRPSANMDGTIQGTQTVRVVKLDDFLGARLDCLKLLKIDTEGYEDEVLQGATGLLRRFKPVVYIELCSQYQASSDRAVTLLREHGYTFNCEVDLGSSANGENFIALPPG